MTIVQGCIEKHVADYVLLTDEGKKYAVPIPLADQKGIKGAVMTQEDEVDSLDNYEWIAVPAKYAYAFRTRAIWQCQVVLNDELADPYLGMEGLCESLTLQEA